MEAHLEILGGKIMIIYAPKKRTEPYESNEQVRQIYLKYKDYIESSDHLVDVNKLQFLHMIR